MATFKEAFAAARKEKGAGKTFTWNGKSYSTNYKEEEKKPTGTKPKAKPIGLNPQSGAAQSGTAGKVKLKVDMPARPTGGAKVKQIAKEAVTASNVASNKAAAKRKAASSGPRGGVMTAAGKAGYAAGSAAGSAAAKALTTFMKMRETLAGGSLFDYRKKK